MAVEAGRELDKEIGVRVFGYWLYHYDKGYRQYWQVLDPDSHPIVDSGWGERAAPGEAWEDIPRYSTDMNAAWTIIAHLMERGMGYTVASGAWPDGRRYHVARFFPPDMSRAFMGDGDAAPVAICRAALMAMDAERGE